MELQRVNVLNQGTDECSRCSCSPSTLRNRDRLVVVVLCSGPAPARPQAPRFQRSAIVATPPVW